jgi:large conductance mechanosensitive channel
MWKEFKEFLSRGSVIDLAVAVVIGTAFTQIVNSLVNDIFTPLIGLAMGGVNFGALAIKIGDATIAYGKFIQAIINFLIVAFAMFLIVQAANRLKKRFEKQEEVKKEVQPSQEVVLLTQIRDLLQNNNNRAGQGQPVQPQSPTPR